MSALVSQLPTIVGVVLGALLTFFFTALADRFRWRRERLAQWDQSRMEAYAAYGRAVKGITEIVVRVAAHRGLGDFSETMSDEEARRNLTTAHARRAAAWERVLLLGNPDTVQAGREWHTLAWDLVVIVFADDTTRDRWTEAMAAAGKARDRYYDEARHSLGVAEDLPPSTWGTWPYQSEVLGDLDITSLDRSHTGWG